MAETASSAALQAIAERAQTAVDADRTTIFQVDRQKGEIYSRVALGLHPGIEIRLPLTRGVIGFVARTGRSLRLRDAYNDPRFDQTVDARTGYRTRSILCVPIRNDRNDVVGAIQAINKKDGAFTDGDEENLIALCAEASPLLDLG